MSHSSISQQGQIEATLVSLPPLPSMLRYWDDYLNTYHVIRDLSASHVWRVQSDGEIALLRFGYLPPKFRPLIKHVAAEMFSRLDATTVIIYQNRLEHVTYRLGANSLIELLVGLSPDRVRTSWLASIAPIYSPFDAGVIRAVLHCLCNLGIAHWSPAWHGYVTRLPSAKYEKNRAIRTGTCFVPLDQQSQIIDYFDELSAVAAGEPGRIETLELRDACALLVSHQHGLRAGQIARIAVPDVRIHGTGAVHIAVPLLKQRRDRMLRRVTRRIKREWCPLFIDYHRRRGTMRSIEGVPGDAYFLLTPQEVSAAIIRLVTKLTGESWTPTDLRHSAAQRLADAGVSHLALSEFMGHARVCTALAYFNASPNQAQRVNDALALSPIYANVAEIARTLTIDKATLLRLPPDKQIGGVPHGIPIAGIGGCSVGQSLCVKNPVLSCYTCRRFMPVNVSSVHSDVVESLRPVVLEFAEASRGNEESPAYVQLRRLLMAAQQVAADIAVGADVVANPPGIPEDE